MKQDYYVLDELRAFIGSSTWVKLSALRFNGLLGGDELIGANAKSFFVMSVIPLATLTGGKT
jgi:hypothetical protein